MVDYLLNVTQKNAAIAHLADYFEVSADYPYDGLEKDAAFADLKDKHLLALFKEIDLLSEEEKPM